jgi:hypothetical protein
VYGVSTSDGGSKKYLYNFDGETYWEVTKTGEIGGMLNVILEK